MLKVAVQMDPIASINPAGDSTFAMMLEAQSRKHKIDYYVPSSLSLRDNRVSAEVAPIRLFDKHGVQVRPIYLPRAAGRPALISGDIQVYFSAGPPLVQMRLSGSDVVVASCVVHKLTSKLVVVPAVQKIADLRGKVIAVANPGSASDFAAASDEVT